MPTFKYKRDEGFTGIFANAKNLEDGTVESDHELNSPYLTLIEDRGQEKMTTETPAAPANVPAPSVPPVVAETPAAPVQPPVNPAPTPNQENKTA